MTRELRDHLSRLGRDFDIPRLDLDDLIAEGDRRVRRRRLGIIAAAAATVAVVLGTATIATDPDEDSNEPVNPVPTQTPAPTAAVGTSRPLVYADGTVIHLGERTVDTGRTIESLDVTDNGAVLTTADGSIWFTDGSDVQRIGATSGGTVDPHSVRWHWSGPRWWVATGNAGSLVAWFENQGEDAQARGVKLVTDLVVFDSGAREEIGRTPVEIRAGFHGVLDVVTDDTVLWSEQGDGAGDDRYWRLRVGGDLEEVSRTSWLSEMSTEPRRIVIPDPYGEGLEATDETSSEHADFPLVHFTVQRGQVVPTTPGGTASYSSPLQPVRNLHLAADLPDNTVLWIAEWLDDGRFVLTNQARDLYTCQISTSSCQLTIPGDEIGGRLVVPTLPS
jgi:hypothetical protein